jgi:hypothetical protein
MSKYTTGYFPSKYDDIIEGSLLTEKEEVHEEGQKQEKSERTEFSVSRTQNGTAMKITEDSKCKLIFDLDLLDDENLKLLEEIKAHRSIPERDCALIEKLFNPHNDSIILNQSEVTAICELLLCTLQEH